MINLEVKEKIKSRASALLKDIKNKSQKDFENMMIDLIMNALYDRDEMKKFLTLRNATIDFLFLEEDGALGICGKEEARNLVDKAFKNAAAEFDHYLDFYEETEKRNEQYNERDEAGKLHNDADRQAEEADTVCTDTANDGSPDSI